MNAIGSGKHKPRWMQAARKSMEHRGTVGSFSAKASRAGESTQEYASHVMADDNAGPALRKQANFAKNAAKGTR